jgi:hypothetical protein
MFSRLSSFLGMVTGHSLYLGEPVGAPSSILGNSGVVVGVLAVVPDGQYLAHRPGDEHRGGGGDDHPEQKSPVGLDVGVAHQPAATEAAQHAEKCIAEGAVA